MYSYLVKNRIIPVTLNNIILSLIMLMVFFMPFSRKVIPPLIICVAIPWLFYGNIFEKIRNIFQHSPHYLLILFYFIHIIGLVYTDNINEGFFDLQVKLGLLIFPVLIFGLPSFFKKYQNTIFLSFVTGNIVSSLVSVIYSSYRTIEYNADYFSYGNLSLFKHTSYASMYVLFSTMILIYFLLNRIYSNHVWIRNIYIGTIIFFCIIIYFLASRAGYVSLFISVVFVAGYLSLRFKKRIYILIVIIVIPSVMYLFVSNPRVKYLVNLPQIVQAGNLNTTYEGVIVRYFIIRESLKIIKEHHWLGTGTGDVKDNLVERYRKSNIKFALENKLNAHNQFLETFIGLGIPGFLTLVLLLFYPLYHAVKRRNFLMISFLLIITVNFLFESMLNTQAGIIFFAFFYSLLMVNIDKTKSDI